MESRSIQEEVTGTRRSMISRKQNSTLAIIYSQERPGQESKKQETRNKKHESRNRTPGLKPWTGNKGQGAGIRRSRSRTP